MMKRLIDKYIVNSRFTIFGILSFLYIKSLINVKETIITVVNFDSLEIIEIFT